MSLVKFYQRLCQGNSKVNQGSFSMNIARVTTVPEFMSTHLRHQIQHITSNNVCMTLVTSPGNLSDSFTWSDSLRYHPIAIQRNIRFVADVISLIKLIRYFRKNRFDIISGKEKGKELKDLTELALSGILYYVSQVLNHLIENGEFQSGANKSKSLRICLGGKASTLYKIVFEDSDEQ